ncbi:Sperm surface protein Sp17 [Trichuris trichiura]|uniref:Sperm surface protein Sp17 n=1 Tax=Trichuris trichiura TaxID=36087 RepID=A0A077Z051_TRITR|nr:Sperm surface protein Sp17 [Trichuris trichiura]
MVALAREVLSNQPKDLYAFGALFFHTLMQVRDGKRLTTNALKAGVDPLLSKHAYEAFQSVLIREVSKFSLVTLLRRSYRMSLGMSTRAGTFIRRRWTTSECSARSYDKDLSATKIQAGIRYVF